MLIVKVELHSAITGRVTELGRMHICNDATSEDPSIGHYRCRTLRKGTHRVQREGPVRDYPRLNLSVWNLVGRALKSMGYGLG